MKNSLFSSKFRIKRFIAFLIIPFLYAFTFIFAFNDPMSKSEKIPFQLVTQADVNSVGNMVNSDFMKALTKELEKPGEIETGEMKLTIKMTHISLDPTTKPSDVYGEVRKIAKNGFTTFYLPPMKDPVTKKLIDKLLVDIKAKNPVSSISSILADLNSVVATISSKTLGSADKINIFNNYRKNYLLGFGSETASSFSGKYTFLADKILSAISSMHPTSSPQDIAIRKHIEKIKKSPILSFKPVQLISKQGEFATYGYGLAPFFISIGLWISALVASLIFHKKIINKNITAGRRFVVKYITASIFIFLQSLVLMVPLYFIGFKDLGFAHWAYTTLMVTFVGIIFLGIVLAIRFLIPNKPFAIILIVILLVIQIVSSDGLFPTETEGKFLTFLNDFMPMGYSVKLFRETMYDTNMNKLFTAMGMISLFWLIPIFASVGYTLQVKTFYKKNDWVYPKHISKRGENV